MLPTNAYFAFYRAKVSDHKTGVNVELIKPHPQLPDAIREHVQAAEFSRTAHRRLNTSLRRILQP